MKLIAYIFRGPFEPAQYSGFKTMTMTTKSSKLFGAILILVVLFPGQTFSVKDPEARDYIAYRHKMMILIKKHYSAIAQIIDNNLPVKEDIVVHARSMHGMLLSFGSLFPEGSGKSYRGEYWTKAKPTVWKDPEIFAAYLLSLQELTLILIDAAERDDMSKVKVTRKHMKTICKTCHHHFKYFLKDVVYEDE